MNPPAIVDDFSSIYLVTLLNLGGLITHHPRDVGMSLI